MTLVDPGPVFAALADPTRRSVLTRLAADGAASATALARELPVTRQAVVQHLAVLDAAGVTRAHRHGREVRHDDRNCLRMLGGKDLGHGVWGNIFEKGKRRRQNIAVGLRRYYRDIKEFLRRVAVQTKLVTKGREDVFREIERGKLRAYKIGEHWRVDEADFEAYLRQRRRG